MNNNFLNLLDSQMNQVHGNKIDNINLIEFKKNFYYVPGFGNVGIIITTGGVVVIDTGINKEHAERIYLKIRERTKLPIRYIIYTHGHMDHVNSTEIFREDKTEIIAHENVAERFRKYETLIDHRKRIGSVQFENKTSAAKSYQFIYPTINFSKEYSFTLGDKTFEIVHGRGETDDHCFIHIPNDDVIYCGDFFIWAFPNIGNPLKEVRFEREWYETVEKIQKRKPSFVVPGHGSILEGEVVIQRALQDVVDCLRFVHGEVIDHMNKGTSLEDMLDLIVLPEHLQSSEYITQTYGCLDFAIKGTYRRYSGWFDGNPTNLHPAKNSEVAQEILSLIKDPSEIIERCKVLSDQGNYQMALHLIDILVMGCKDSLAIKTKIELIEKISESNDNFISRNIYRQLALKSKEKNN
jgi:alkyl sulfatase BDS1-like metallo-beta-lactamase superfamily hydrolase